NTKTISADTTIDGGSVITISGGGTVTIFSVNSGVTFTVQNLIVANGHGPPAYGIGGAITNRGTLAVTDSTFLNNQQNPSGGAINNVGGTMTVTNCTFSGNSAENGGAI